MRISHKFFVFFFATIFIAFGCKSTQEQNQLIVFHAGSLTVPVKEIIANFNEAHPNIKVYSEAAGSVASVRKITDLKRHCDVFLSADYNVINNFLIPEHADWNIAFAANEMVIAYHEKSNRNQDIDQTNWVEIMMDENVRFGRSDPDSDPCGYRTILTVELTEKRYNKNGLLEAFLKKDTHFIRPKETDLIALMETNTIDYIFIYRSVAVQHNFPFLLLSDSLNLKSPRLSDWYKNASIEINGKKPGEKILQTGEPMIYSLTIPKKAPNPELALEFVEFLLSSNEGMAIMEKNGQPSLIPSPAWNFENVPEKLKSFALPDKK